MLDSGASNMDFISTAKGFPWPPKPEAFPRLILPKKLAPQIVARSSKLPVDNMDQPIIPCFKEPVDHHFGLILIFKNTQHGALSRAINVDVERNSFD